MSTKQTALEKSVEVFKEHNGFRDKNGQAHFPDVPMQTRECYVVKLRVGSSR